VGPSCSQIPRRHLFPARLSPGYATHAEPRLHVSVSNARAGLVVPLHHQANQAETLQRSATRTACVTFDQRLDFSRQKDQQPESCRLDHRWAIVEWFHWLQSSLTENRLSRNEQSRRVARFNQHRHPRRFSSDSTGTSRRPCEARSISPNGSRATTRHVNAHMRGSTLC
jgi:hypothetical protein